MNDYPLGATPVDAHEAAALLPGHITTRDDLNEWEQANIADAMVWVRRTASDPLLPKTVTDLHRRMFDRTWQWAGKFRDSNKNIGVPKESIGEELKKLLDDARYWFENEVFPKREAAIRLHHRVVWIHPFPNGNGRHARLWADLVVRQRGGSAIAWGGGLGDAGRLRGQYIDALRAADKGDYQLLLRLYAAENDP